MMNRVIFSVLLVAAAGPAPAAVAAGLDGNWSVLIITEKGNCDRGYRYDVKIANGQVSYHGDAPVNLAGTVASNGLVKVSIKSGDKGADGSGHLAAGGGSGIWHGAGANGGCSGRWEAERR